MDIQTYPYSRGKAVFFCMHKFIETEHDRIGADLDILPIMDAFEQLNFEIQLHENKPSHDLLDIMSELYTHDYSNWDSFALIISSHGNDENGGSFLCSDLNFIALNNIVKPLGTCKTLIGKPKLLFVQACRGSSRSLSLEHLNNEHDAVFAGTSSNDFLYSYSTVPGTVSNRHRKTGTWYLKALADVLKEHGTSLEIRRMLTIVNRLVGERTNGIYSQCCETIDRLGKELLFGTNVQSIIQIESSILPPSNIKYCKRCGRDSDHTKERCQEPYTINGNPLFCSNCDEIFRYLIDSNNHRCPTKYSTSSPEYQRRIEQKSGVCIRGGERIRLDPDKPFCRDCFSIWVQWSNYDYEENYCHICGKDWRTSMDKPLCIDCWKIY